MKVYLAVLDYSDGIVNEFAVDTHDDNYQTDELESILEAKGYNLNEISYMSSNEPIPIITY